MKNIEQILKDAGIEITDEQKTAVNEAVKANYKTIADYDKQAKKLEAAEVDRDTYKQQYEDAQEAIKGFEGVDVEKLNKDIADWKEKAAQAEKDAQKQILQRDQRDYLKAEFDKLGITSERTRASLMRDIMDENDGLKWKDNAFMGLSDYLSKENEKDHFYQTEEEKAAAEAEKKAAEGAPKFTAQSEGKKEPPKESGTVPLIF